METNTALSSESRATALWTKTFKRCEGKFSEEDLKEIRNSNGVDDLLVFVDKEHKKGDSKVLPWVIKVKRFSELFTVYQNLSTSYFKELLLRDTAKKVLGVYEQILRALNEMGRTLQLSGFSIDTNTFSDSPEYADALAEFYVSFIDFWSEALRFLRRPLYQNMIRVVGWNFPVTVEELQAIMSKNQENATKCAEAVDRARSEKLRVIAESGWANSEVERKEQQEFRYDAQYEKINRWLAPGHYPVHEYEHHYLEKLKNLHTGTCQWVQELDTFKAWMKPWKTESDKLLWISAAPGAGKTALSSWLINHLRGTTGGDRNEVLYYMFDRKNVDKSSDIAAACAMMHQLMKRPGLVNQGTLKEMIAHIVDSGQEKASDFVFIWNIIISYVRNILRVIFVIDGLDECSQRVSFLSSIFELMRGSGAKVIILSRYEAELPIRLSQYLKIWFGNGENHLDILVFLRTGVAKSKNLNKGSVQRRIQKRHGADLAEFLGTRANGSIIWATCALKELGSKATAREVVAAAEGLPSDLIDFYMIILQGYNRRYHGEDRRICCLVIRWLVCASRPLSSDELLTGVRSDYLKPLPVSGTSDHANSASDNDSSDESDDEFNYEKSDIERWCDTLVNTNNGMVQLAHESIAEFLGQKPHGTKNEEINEFFVDRASANLCISTVCIDHILTSLGTPPIQPEDEGTKLTDRVLGTIAPFSKYSVYLWPYHLVTSGPTDLTPAKRKLTTFLNGPKMLYWLEMWLEDQTVWDLKQQLQNITRWCASRGDERLLEGSFTTFLYRWCQGVVQLLERYGPTLEKDASKIHFIDPLSFDDPDPGMPSTFSNFVLPDPPLHTPHLRLQSQALSRSALAIRNLNLHHHLSPPRHDVPLFTVFHVDKKRGVVLMASYYTPSPTLSCQDILTGHKFKPARLHCQYKDDRNYYCEGFSISKDGSLLALLHRSTSVLDGQHTNNMYDINIFKLANVFDPEDDTKPWCDLLASMSHNSRSLGPSPQPMAIDSSNVFHCPWGEFELD